jgi:PHD/YefM family antitoxin component YafN of YafNO toxin-antitoxin module
MSSVTATEFAEGFGRFKEEAQRQPVAITSYGRISGYFVSAHEYEELRRLREFERRVYRLKGLPEGMREAIKRARMDASHEHLNALLDEKQCLGWQRSRKAEASRGCSNHSLAATRSGRRRRDSAGGVGIPGPRRRTLLGLPR